MAGGSDRRVGFEEFTGLSVGRALLMSVPALALIVGAFWLAVQFLDPVPPRRIVLATGPEGSVLHALGTRYAERMAMQGIVVDVRTTRGAADNAALLADRSAGVDAAFLVAGAATSAQAAAVVNVSNLSYAPLICLSRDPSGEVMLAGLRGKRITVGAAGSGLNALLGPLLVANGVTPANTTLLEVAPDVAVQALASGEVDAIFLGDGVRGPEFAQAIQIPGVRLLHFPRAEAYERRFRHIVRLHLPQGTVDLARDTPDHDLTLIGTTLMIAARGDTHPTVVDLLVDTARQLHSGQGMFERRGEFPHLHDVDDVPVSAQALQYVREGPSLLRRYLPLWAADALQRALVIALPLLAVMIPIVRFLPAILDLVARRHLFFGYARLRRVERTLRARDRALPADDLLKELDRIEESVAGEKESVMKAGELYNFRVHVGVVRDAVNARGETLPAAGEGRAPTIIVEAGEAQ